MGLGVVMSNARLIPDALFLVAAEMVADKDIQEGSLYPRLKEIHVISLAIAAAAAEKSYDLGIAQNEKPKNIKQTILDYMYDPSY